MSEIMHGDAGRVAFLLKGDYENTETYDFLDVVYYNGASYGAKKETNGNPPARDSEYWQMFAGYELTKEDIHSILGYIPTEAFAKKSVYDDTNVSVGRKNDTTSGELSFAFGQDVEASATRTFAFGRNVKATSNNAHAEGSYTTASGSSAHAEGYDVTASGENSHAEGGTTHACGTHSHSEGGWTTAFSLDSHASGGGSVSVGVASYSEGLQTISGNGYILHVKSVDVSEKRIRFAETYENFGEAFSKVSVGIKIHVINTYYINSASVFTVKSIDANTNSVIVEEDIPSSKFTPWLAVLSVANTINATSHSEGQKTIANGMASHAENYYTIASGEASHAGGYLSESKGVYSFAHGRGVIAGSSRQTAVGWYNVDDGTPNNFKNPFVVGIGADENNRSNGFRVNSNGAVYGKFEYNSSGADYAEFIKEWHDGNPDSEDRVGYFVTVKDGYLYKANEGDYIVGITSGNPSIVGNSDEEYYWRWERDEFNRIIYEEVPELTEKFDENEMLVMDENGNPVMVETGRTITIMKQREDYDISKQSTYIERKDRKEWDYIGMVGIVPVRDDGTCQVGRYCKCGKEGIATLANQRDFDTYMVLDRISENVVSVILK